MSDGGIYRVDMHVCVSVNADSADEAVELAMQSTSNWDDWVYIETLEVTNPDGSSIRDEPEEER